MLQQDTELTSTVGIPSFLKIFARHSSSFARSEYAAATGIIMVTLKMRLELEVLRQRN